MAYLAPHRLTKDTMQCVTYLLVCLLISADIVAGDEFIRFEITEERPVGTEIGNLVEAAGLDKIYSNDVLSQLRFSVLEQVPSDDLVSVDYNTGRLTVGKTLDRDVMCARQTKCVAKLIVQVQPVEYVRILQVAVTVIDVNDNAPVFAADTKTLSLMETSPLGIVLSLPRAIDPDSPQFSIQRYELLGGADTFELKTEGTDNIRLLLKKTLDYENRKAYSIKLVAYDGGSPPKSGHLQIDVSVLDANDNKPRFESTSYEITVDENLPLETTIIRVMASDADTGVNGEVVYGFSDESADMFDELFTIDTGTGDVVVIGNLDYEQHKSCILTVTARNKDPESLVVTTKVTINIRDLNDNSPIIKVNALPSSGQLEVLEGAPIGTYVVYLTVRDYDSGANGNFSCTLSSKHFAIKRLHKTGFKIETSAELDREAISKHDVTLVCIDSGATPRLASETLVIHVLDKNDDAPRFTQATYVASVLENNVPGAFIIQVMAHDADANENGEISYSIKDEAGNRINIDADSGNITAVSALDYEQSHRIEFSVIATDHGMPSLTNIAKVIITIIDVDDEKPVFSKTHYEFPLYENVALGAEVGTVSAIDADSSLFNNFFFSIHPVMNADNSFGIDPDTGKIFTTKQMDKEAKAVYNFVVLATSSGLRAVSTNVSVSVLLSDRNDNKPIIDYPNVVYNNTVFVSPEFPIGHIIYHVMAHDDDTGLNAQLSFKIISGNHGNVFQIDRTSGVLTVAAMLDELDHERFNLVISVSDGGIPRLTTECNVNIVVNDSVVYGAVSNTREMSNQNLTIVVCIAAITAVLTAILLAAILIIVRRHGGKNWNDKYRCHIQVNDRKALTGGTSSTDGAAYLDGTSQCKCEAQDSNDSYGSEQPFSMHSRENPIDCSSLQIQVDKPGPGSGHEGRSLRTNLSRNPSSSRWFSQSHNDKTKNPGSVRHVPVSPGGRDSDSGCSGDNITDSGRGSNEDVSMEMKNQRRSAGDSQHAPPFARSGSSRVQTQHLPPGVQKPRRPPPPPPSTQTHHTHSDYGHFVPNGNLHFPEEGSVHLQGSGGFYHASHV